MSKFNFETDSESEAYCRAVVEELIRQFKLSAVEATGRVNRHWAGTRFVGDCIMLYHEAPQDLAKIIYFGPETKWWTDQSHLKPKAYP